MHPNQYTAVNMLAMWGKHFSLKVTNWQVKKPMFLLLFLCFGDFLGEITSTMLSIC
jgi:hypothetical protein